MTKLQKSVIAAVLVAATGFGIFQARDAFRLRAENSKIARQLAQLQAGPVSSPAATAENGDEQERTREERRELLRLRNEVAQLRLQVAEQAPPGSTAAAPRAGSPVRHRPGSYVSKDQLTYAGFDTPESALETVTWAMVYGTIEQANEGLGPELRGSQSVGEDERQEFEESQKKMAPFFNGLQIVARKALAEDKVELKVKLDHSFPPGEPAAPPEFLIQPLVKIGDAWKLGGSTREHKPEWDADGQIETFAP